MDKQYVEQRDQGYWIAGSRVSLASILFAFKEGLSPETIAAECFPTLTLEQVYGAITYYLAHRDEVEASLQQSDAAFESVRAATQKADPDFTARLLRARRNIQAPRA